MRFSSSKASLALLVAGLHALLLLGAWRLQAWQDRGPPAPAQAPLIVWLQGAAQPGAAPAQAAPGPRWPPAAAPALPAPTAAPARPQAITLPVPVPVPVPDPAGAAAAAAAPAPAPAQAPVLAEPAAASPTPASSPRPAAPLNLALPGRARSASAPWRGVGVERNPALDDPRSNSPKPTLESRIAAALGGSDQITEFRLEDGSVRLKRGNACVVVRPNRAAALDPFNASTQLHPRLLDRC